MRPGLLERLSEVVHRRDSAQASDPGVAGNISLAEEDEDDGDFSILIRCTLLRNGSSPEKPGGTCHGPCRGGSVWIFV